MVAYVPFCGVTHGRYATSLGKMGMEPSIAIAATTDSIYRRPERYACQVLSGRESQRSQIRQEALILCGETEGNAQSPGDFDTHPLPAGYATITHHIYGGMAAVGCLKPRKLTVAFGDHELVFRHAIECYGGSLDRVFNALPFFLSISAIACRVAVSWESSRSRLAVVVQCLVVSAEAGRAAAARKLCAYLSPRRGRIEPEGLLVPGNSRRPISPER